MPLSFELRCEAYEALADYLATLLRYKEAEAQEIGDDEEIVIVRNDLKEKRTDMIARHGVKAKQYFASKQK